MLNQYLLRRKYSRSRLNHNPFGKINPPNKIHFSLNIHPQLNNKGKAEYCCQMLRRQSININATPAFA